MNKLAKFKLAIFLNIFLLLLTVAGFVLATPTYACNSDADCDDFRDCTPNRCAYPGEAGSYCYYPSDDCPAVVESSSTPTVTSSPSPTPSPSSSPTPTPSPSSSPSPSPSVAPAKVTTGFRFLDQPFNKNRSEVDLPFQPYTDDPMIVNYTLANVSIGRKKTIYVQFKYIEEGETKTSDVIGPMEIDYVGADPIVDYQNGGSLNCSLDPSNNNLSFNVKGSNFHTQKGTLLVQEEGNEQNLDVKIKQWTNDKIQAVLERPNVSLNSGKTYKIKVQRDDGQTTPEPVECSVGLSQVQLGAKLFCRLPNQHTQDNVDLTLLLNEPGSRALTQKVSIDSKGNILGLNTNLQEGKEYKMAIKAPKALMKVIKFLSSAGTTVVPGLSLAVGDIFPLDGGDGKVNSADYAELRREWILGTSTSANRPGDFNQDGQVNSIDYSCLREDFNKSDDPEPTPDNPSPTPQASTPPSSPSPTPSSNPPSITGDINNDGRVNNTDFASLVADFGKSGTSLASDINHDSRVNILDFNLVVKNYGRNN